MPEVKVWAACLLAASLVWMPFVASLFGISSLRQIADKDVITTLVALSGVLLALISFRSTTTYARETSDRQNLSFTLSVRPILYIEMFFDPYETRIDLVNYGLGVAVIDSFWVYWNGRKTENLYRFVEFGERKARWKQCASFSNGRHRYLKPGSSLYLLHQDRDFFLAQKDEASWITEEYLVSFISEVNMRLAEFQITVEYSNVLGDKMEPLHFDFSKYIPLPLA